MTVTLAYCDTGAPSRHLRFLEVGNYHQVLSDGQVRVESLLVRPGTTPQSAATAILAHSPELSVVYVDEFNLAPSLALVAALRATQSRLSQCAVGIFPILGPEKLLADGAFDYLVIGEGEVALYELATLVTRGAEPVGIKNVWFRQAGALVRNPLRPLQENLDQLPYPDRTLFVQDGQRAAGDGPPAAPLYVAASRGCPYECLFCYNSVVKRVYEGKGASYRMRSPQHVVGEILSEMRRGSYSHLVFADEMFPSERAWLRTFGARLTSVFTLGFEVAVSSERCDPDTLELLQVAGCSGIRIGMETGSEPLRKRIAARNLSTAKLQELVGLAKERGIRVHLHTMAGLPGETAESLGETLALAQTLAPDSVASTVYQPIEATGLGNYVRERGLVAAKGAAPPDFTHSALEQAQMTPEVIRSHLLKIRFLDISQKLKGMPVAPGYFDFMHQLPQARFSLGSSGALGIGTTERAGREQPYVSLLAGSSIRYPVTVKPGSLFRFALHMPATDLVRLSQAGAQVAAEVLWIVAGRELPLFQKTYGGSESGGRARWHDCVTVTPEEESAGEIMLRVAPLGEVQAPVTVQWGQPYLIEPEAAGIAARSAAEMRGEYEGRLAKAADEAAALARRPGGGEARGAGGTAGARRENAAPRRDAHADAGDGEASHGDGGEAGVARSRPRGAHPRNLPQMKKPRGALPRGLLKKRDCFRSGLLFLAQLHARQVQRVESLLLRRRRGWRLGLVAARARRRRRMRCMRRVRCTGRM